MNRNLSNISILLHLSNYTAVVVNYIHSGSVFLRSQVIIIGTESTCSSHEK